MKARSGILLHTLFSKERLLWQRGDSTSDECPSLLPVSISFPSTYWDKDHGRPHRLPPSMSIRHPCRVAVVHSLSVVVRKVSCPIFPRTKSVIRTCNVFSAHLKLCREVRLSAYLRYSPRDRPPRQSPLSFSFLKTCPEEWQEEIWGMTKRSPGEGKEPLIAQCHVSHVVQSPFTGS